MVRAEGARLGLAHADAIEPHATSALADERLIVQWRRSQDNAAPREHERRRPEDHREAWRPQDDGSPQDHRALDGEAHHTAQLRDTQKAPLSQARD